jgi:tetratricopeptide (TPR) repeat protein
VAARAQAVVSLIYVGAYAEAEPLLRDLEASWGRDREDDSAHEHVLFARYMHAYYNGFFEKSCEIMEEIIARCRVAGNERQLCVNRFNLATSLLALGAYAEGTEMLRAALVDAERLGLRKIIGVGKHCLALALIQLGALEEARELVTDAIERFKEAGDRRFEALARSYRAMILERSGDSPGAAEEAGRAVDRARGLPTPECLALAVLARALLSQGRAEEALSAARRAVEIVSSYKFIEEGAEAARLAYAEALWAVGDPAARAAIADARAQIMAYAARIKDSERRATYLDAVPENARTLKLALEWLGPMGDGES